MVALERRLMALAGDLMLDAYTFGNVDRISPEAPVPVLHVTHENNQPGGGGNVALNIAALGCDVRVMGRVGCDEAGQLLIEALESQGVCCQAVARDAAYHTPRKNRLIGGNQQMVRMDHEKVLPVKDTQAYFKRIPEFLSGVDVLTLSDYDKGLLTPAMTKALIQGASVPVIVDPKGVDFSKYRGAFLIKPNVKEAYLASGLPRSSSLEKVAEKLLAVTMCQALIITQSEKGITLFRPETSPKTFQTKRREVKDVTGAGDTVLATLSVAIANKLDLDEAIVLANAAAGIAVEGLGCRHVTFEDIQTVLT